jgi:hypothetical protein
MTTSKRNWRVEHHVERLAREENRASANMMAVLLRESTRARLAREQSSGDADNRAHSRY